MKRFLLLALSFAVLGAVLLGAAPSRADEVVVAAVAPDASVSASDLDRGVLLMGGAP